jgi:hypothetical protein
MMQSTHQIVQLPITELTLCGHALSALTVADSASNSLSLTALRSSTLLLLPGAAAAAALSLAAKSLMDASFMSLTCSRLACQVQQLPYDSSQYVQGCSLAAKSLLDALCMPWQSPAVRKISKQAAGFSVSTTQ